MGSSRIPWLLAVLAGTACGDHDDRYRQGATPLGPYVVGEAVAYMDRAFSEVVVLVPRAGERDVRWHRSPVSEGASVLTVLSGRRRLLLKDDEQGLLTSMSPLEGEFRSTSLNGPYDRFSINEDAGVMALYYGTNAAGTDLSPYVNQAEISFVDLDSGEVRRLVIPTYGGAPQGVEITPKLDVGGQPRTLAFVRWKSFLSVVDLSRGDSVPVKVPLKAQDSTATVLPSTLSFWSEGTTLKVFFLAAGTIDLYELDIDLVHLGDGGKGVKLNLFPTAAGASSFSLVDLPGDGLRVMVLCQVARTVAMVDPARSTVQHYTLSIVPRTSQVFDMLNVETEMVEKMALILDHSGGATTYYLAQLEHLATKKSKAFRAFTLPSPLTSVVMLPGGERFLALHQGGQDSMSQVTLADGSIISVGGTMSVLDRQFSADRSNVFVLGQRSGVRYLTRLDTATFAARTLVLPPEFTGSKMALNEKERLALLYDNDGQVLVFGSMDFEREEDLVVLAFPALSGLEH